MVDLVSLTDALGLRVCVTQAKRKAGTMGRKWEGPGTEVQGAGVQGSEARGARGLTGA